MADLYEWSATYGVPCGCLYEATLIGPIGLDFTAYCWECNSVYILTFRRLADGCVCLYDATNGRYVPAELHPVR